MVPSPARPNPAGAPAAGPDSGPGGNSGAALTWLAASGAGRQQGAAQTESRGDEQQLPRPHCPEAQRGSGRRPGLPPARAPCALPAAAGSSRPPRRTCGPAERSLPAHRRTLASARELAGLQASPVARPVSLSERRRGRGRNPGARETSGGSGEGRPPAPSVRLEAVAARRALPSPSPRVLGPPLRGLRLRRPRRPLPARTPSPAPAGSRPLPGGGIQTRQFFLWAPLTREALSDSDWWGLRTGRRGLGGCSLHFSLLFCGAKAFAVHLRAGMPPGRRPPRPRARPYRPRAKRLTSGRARLSIRKLGISLKSFKMTRGFNLGTGD